MTYATTKSSGDTRKTTSCRCFSGFGLRDSRHSIRAPCNVKMNPTTTGSTPPVDLPPARPRRTLANSECENHGCETSVTGTALVPAAGPCSERVEWGSSPSVACVRAAGDVEAASLWRGDATRTTTAESEARCPSSGFSSPRPLASSSTASASAAAASDAPRFSSSPTAATTAGGAGGVGAFVNTTPWSTRPNMMSPAPNAHGAASCPAPTSSPSVAVHPSSGVSEYRMVSVAYRIGG
mmetsp:Transcript_22059/g.77323  ORF Transcript_22059/g.77323 Transcript_22059/m.77323 type:complete len:238 (-) Transcript_22059:4378-5091(-)